MMRFKPKKVQINKDDPFKNDLLKRSEFITNIIELIKISDDSLNIALTGKYGIGKTTTLEMLRYHAENDGSRTIYFNAWEFDYSDDPFSSILSEITELLPAYNEIKDKLLDAGANILKIGIPAIIKAATMNLIDLSDATEEIISKITSEFASAELEKHLTLKKDIDNFKEKLKNAVQIINSNGKNVIIIIDELDRCKPTYAVRLLEAIKHLFDIENINFIMGLDYNQLKESIAHVYGRETDTDGYLRRFFDFQIELSEPNLKNYIDFLFESYELQEIMQNRSKIRENQYDKGEFINILYFFCDYYKASLRDVEKCFNIFAYVIASTEEKYFIFPGVLAYLIVLYLFDKEFYQRIIKNKVNCKEIADKFYYDKLLYEKLKMNDDIDLIYFIGLLTITSSVEKYGTNLYEYHDSVINDVSIDEEYKRYIEGIKKSAEDHQSRRRYGNVMSYLEKKLNFIDSIKNIST